MTGKELKAYREGKSLSQSELAKKLNLSRSYVNRLEQNSYPIKKKTEAKICRFFKISHRNYPTGVTKQRSLTLSTESQPLMSSPNLKFKTPDEFKNACTSYFDKADAKDKHVITKDGMRVVDLDFEQPYTVEGLLIELGISRQTFKLYQTDKRYEPFHFVVEWALLKIGGRTATGMLDKSYDSKGAQLYLKNQLDYKDKVDIESHQEIDFNINIIPIANRDEYEQFKKDFPGELPEPDEDDDFIEAEFEEMINNEGEGDV